ncbi:MAG: DUF1622 domain-containing protein [Nitrospirota bacterium]|nr:DUF1622 domain-containing protein [Nitrospirota bacterium]
MEHLREWIELASQGVEMLAVVIMVSMIVFGTIRWIFRYRTNMESGYERYRVVLGKTLLIGLELLVAADIIRTVAIDLTLTNIALLAALVVVRTFLGWSLTVEIEGHWPWQGAKKFRPGAGGEKENSAH